MKDTEVHAIREMAATAKRGNNVRIAQWREDDPTRIGQSRIWVCAWYAERDPDNMHCVGWRRTEEEVTELIASAARLLADIVKPEENHNPQSDECQLTGAVRPELLFVLAVRSEVQ